MRVTRAGAWRGRLRTAACMVMAMGLLAPATASAVPRPGQDPFYMYDGATPLADLAPGTVTKTRTVTYHVSGIALPVKALQIAYRSTSQLGRPTVNATTILRPLVRRGPSRLVSYQSFYDSLSPYDQPSHAIAGGVTLGGAIMSVEAVLIAPLLQQGYAVAIPDTQGQSANFAAGLEYGYNTLDGLRAAFNTPLSRLADDTKIGMLGYSGGAIATEWAAELAPKYAPDIDRRLVGAAFGGVLVKPSTNLGYVDGSTVWAGVIPMAVIGIARSFEVDLKPYLNDRGLRLVEKMKNDSIANVLGQYPGLTWKSLTKPEYHTPEDIPIYVEKVNQLIMGSYGTPTTPLFIGQGAKGELEGTKGNKPGIGKGDGVMVAGDVRALARKFCDQGVTVKYRQYGAASHIGAALTWTPQAMVWLNARFKGAPASSNCGEIAPGNSLEPIGPPASPAG
ncbi:MAG: triacylglycerol lipase [Solirubrobacteraceae bacterium]|nr:triacylglycerol lipase [Solirubrobacteraceae bacterium]